jgi:hypothetical protein
MGLRVWADPDTGEIIGWPGLQNRYHGTRTYLFIVEEAELEGATVRHHLGGFASLRLADGTSISESRHRYQSDPLPLGSRWVTCDDAGVPIANELA